MRPWLTGIAVIGVGVAAFAWLGARLPDAGVAMREFKNTDCAGEPEAVYPMHDLDLGHRGRRAARPFPEHGSVELVGWVFAPRAGEYGFRVEGPDETTLRVDGRPVLRKGRKQAGAEGTVRLAQGFRPLRVTLRRDGGPTELRVSWRLPAGYMDMEAIPPAYLRPGHQPPARVAVPLWQRLVPPVLIVVGALFLVWPAVRRRIQALRRLDRRRVVLVGAAVVALGLGVRLVDLSGAGETSDEWAYAMAGRIYVANLLRGDLHADYWHSNEEHPPIGKLLYGAVAYLSGTDNLGPLRVASALCGALTILLTYLFGLRFLTPFAAQTGALVLALLPTFVAHGKVAALDSPSALLFTAAVYLLVVAAVARDRQNARLLLATFVASLAFATKFSNVLVFGFALALLLLVEWERIRLEAHMRLPVAVVAMPVLPGLVLVACWPWLWTSPFGQLIKTLQHWDYGIHEVFLGQARQPPWYYFPVVFLATLPALLLLPLGAGVVRVLRHPSRIGLILLLWIVTPFGWSLSTLKQDGIRYIYPVYPAVALAIGVGLESLLRRAVARRVAMPVLAAYLSWQCATVHPYYLDYYSEVLGGAGTVYRLAWFETGWWGEGLDRAFDWLNANAKAGDTWSLESGVTHTADLVRTDLRLSTVRPRWVVRVPTFRDDEHLDGYVEAHRVEAAGAPLALVLRRADSPP